ncbi:MAG TPA: VTT domain-containing protein [Candidatus Saccharimonas sp.]|jgi:membrane-associated protein|nr:VTT domain-containing protein [Candidatus Saccharimonas sp.]
MEALLNFITGLGVIAVLFVIYAESGLLIGFLFPGDSLLFTAGFLVQQGIGSFGSISIHLFAFLLFLCALLGQQTGYFFGKKVGRKLFDRPNSRFFRKENLVRTEQFYEKYGPIAIVLACFVPIVRTFVPIVAGVSKMTYRQFLPYNIVGAFLWTYGFTYLGYYAGKVLHDMGINVEIAALIIIFLSITPMLWHALHTKERRANLWAGTKRELRIVFGKARR